MVPTRVFRFMAEVEEGVSRRVVHEEETTIDSIVVVVVLLLLAVDSVVIAWTNPETNDPEVLKVLWHTFNDTEKRTWTCGSYRVCVRSLFFFLLVFF
jgi:hypothetical protein